MSYISRVKKNMWVTIGYMKTTALNRRVAPLYNKLINQATSEYLHAEPADLPALMRSEWRRTHPKVDIENMNGSEFTSLVLETPRQPLNPIDLARKGLELAGIDITGMSELDLSASLRTEYERLLIEYKDNHVDPSALALVWEMIHLTEAYIAGYSRELGCVAMRLEDIDPKFDAFTKWNNQIWVPDEDMHDKIMGWILSSTGIIDQRKFYSDHSRHMKIGNHVDLSSFITANTYVTLQEDATVISYENAAKIYGPVFGYIFAQIAANEAQHKRAYRHVHLGLSKEFPEETVIATRDACDAFEMPGHDGIEKFEQMAVDLGFLGLLDLHSTYESQSRLVESMGIECMDLKSRNANIAREKLLAGTNKGALLAKNKTRQLEVIREGMVRRASRQGKLRPLIVDITVSSEPATRRTVFLS
jgi:hypothetical protein